MLAKLERRLVSEFEVHSSPVFSGNPKWMQRALRYLRKELVSSLDHAQFLFQLANDPVEDDSVQYQHEEVYSVRLAQRYF